MLCRQQLVLLLCALCTVHARDVALKISSVHLRQLQQTTGEGNSYGPALAQQMAGSPSPSPSLESEGVTFIVTLTYNHEVQKPSISVQAAKFIWSGGYQCIKFSPPVWVCCYIPCQLLSMQPRSFMLALAGAAHLCVLQLRRSRSSSKALAISGTSRLQGSRDGRTAQELRAILVRAGLGSRATAVTMSLHCELPALQDHPLEGDSLQPVT